ncbi:DUF6279 family lipoprotein [Hydrogenophaga aquatica]
MNLRSSRWAAVLLTLALVGCSVVTLAYNRIPTILYWRLDSMVDLSSAQSAWLRPELDNWHAWHRRAQLPSYADALARWRIAASRDLQPATVCEGFGLMRTWVNDMVVQGLPALTRLARELTPEQVDHLRRHYQKEDDTFRQDFMNGNGSPSRKRLERAIDRAETFYGTLTAEQRLWVRQRMQQSAFKPDVTLAERQRRQQDLLDTLAAVQAGSNPLPLLQAYWFRVNRAPSTGYDAYAKAVVDDGCAFIAELHNRTTAQQRQQAANKLGEFEQIFRALAAQP